jgi:hypothetical protein
VLLVEQTVAASAHREIGIQIPAELPAVLVDHRVAGVLVDPLERRLAARTGMGLGSPSVPAQDVVDVFVG